MSNEDIYFLKGNENIITSKKLGEGKNPVDLIKEQFSKILEIKNFSFLLGSGCSSFEVQCEQVGIPTMKALANEFFSINESQADDFSLKKDDKTWLREEIKLDVETKPLSKNIEKFLGALTSIKFYNDISNVDCEVKEKHDRIERIIKREKPIPTKKMSQSS